jgi:iron(III) transport system substrate-binding protein
MVDERSRRRVLLGASAGAAALAGCTALPGGGGATETVDGGSGSTRGGLSIGDFRGSGGFIAGRPDPDAPSVRDLPDLAGELSIYIGGGEGGLYRDLIGLLREEYPDFDPTVRTVDSANVLIEEYEAGTTPADVYWAVDAGSLGAVADAGAFAALAGETLGDVPDAFHPNDRWVGVAGRARSLPYNTDALSEGDIPDTVMDLPETDFAGEMGWAPTYSAFQAFVTAMRLLEGADRTREWLTAMRDAGVTEYPDEFVTSNAVADGEAAAGFANHYYALRVQAARPDAPIALAFTANDPGALINVAGIGILNDTDRRRRAARFVRHLLSAEAQEFFATRTFAYPMVPGILPAGGLPPIDELEPPEVDLAALSDLEPTLELMREVGVL